MGSARITFLLALGASLGAAAPLAPEAELPRPEAQASASVTVTAEAIPVELVQTPNAVVVLDKAAIDRRGAANLGELLADALPGQVLASGGVGTASSIYLGGTRPQDTVVVLDGLRLDDATGLGGVNASMLDLAGIDRVEVQTGPCSSRFGSEALGGAVALYSAASAPAGFSGETRAAVGNLGIARGTLGIAYGWDQGWARAAFSAQKGDQVLDPANYYRSADTFLGLGRQLGDSTLLTVNYVNTFAGVPVPIAYIENSPGPRYSGFFVPGRQDFNRTEVVSGTARTVFSPVLSGELTLGQVQQRRLEPDYITSLPTSAFLSRRNQAVGHLTWQPSAAGSLTAGLDASDEFARSPALSGTDQMSASARHLAVLVEGQRQLAGDLRLTGSLRTERDRQTAPTASTGTLEDDTTQTTGKLGLNWILPAGFRAYASAGTGFSNPLLYNTIFNAFYGGVPLADEKSRTLQGGLTHAEGPWQAGLELSRTLYDSLVFYNPALGATIHDPVYGDYKTGIYQNGAQIRIQSAVFRLGYATDRWGADGFYRNQEARDLLAPAGQQLSQTSVVRRPFQTVGAHAFRVLGDVRLEGRWSWLGPRYDANIDSSTGAAFREHFNDLSLSAAWAARPDLTLTLRGEHLLQPNTTSAQWLARTRDFENDASQIFGAPAQPPTCTLEVRYRF